MDCFYFQNCQSRPIRVFIFGDCFKEHWKVQISTAVALLSPAYGDQVGSRNDMTSRQFCVNLSPVAYLLSKNFFSRLEAFKTQSTSDAGHLSGFWLLQG